MLGHDSTPMNRSRRARQGRLRTAPSVVMNRAGRLSALAACLQVVNAREVAELEHAGVPLYAVNLAVGVSLMMPGVAADIAKGILGNLPFGAQSIAGVRCARTASPLRAASCRIMPI